MAGAHRLEVGRIVRPHGIRGEVVVELVTNRPQRVAVASELFAGDRRLVVERSRPHHDRFIVAFEGVVDRNAAEAFRGAVLCAEPLDELPDEELWLHELIGAEVFDTAGVSRGRVVAIEVNPAHDLLVLDSGALVPLPFVVDPGPERVVVDPPAGLFDADFVEANRAGVERRKPARKRRPGGGR